MLRFKYIIIILVSVIIINFIIKLNSGPQLDKLFFSLENINLKFLYDIEFYFSKIQEEILLICNDKSNKWHRWPDKISQKDELIKLEFMPLYGFGFLLTKNIKKCQNLTRYLQTIFDLRLVLILKIPPKFISANYSGWGYYSNDVIRCSYGIKVLNNCFIHVSWNNHSEKKMYAEGKWIIFDDSKNYRIENESDNEIIILIIDIERPSNISKGKLFTNDASELLNVTNIIKEEINK